ncbi:ThuA domain-containing protein [uncultured Winogradskyella sp.]|uniref:ThuA domain-containing protein n=1 Tax=uncultured Winogradskyella sp. TaxID=395353 RepID=UPI002636A6A6|nr:ThuA domain-containing protein [uncultured Winogradskyella sp.]
MNIKVIICFLPVILLPFGVMAQKEQPNLLVFTKTEGFRHKSIPAGINLMTELARNNNWNISFTEDSNDFEVENLKQYNVIVFLNTTGNVFNARQKEALKTYMASGKGFIGIHAATNTEMEWLWFTDMIGAVFRDHPKVQNATLRIEKSIAHLAINHLNETEVFRDEWYNFKKPVSEDVNVLAYLDEESYQGKKMNTKNHPITWYHHYNGGRVFYTGMGHTAEIYEDSRFKKLIQGAINWALDTE